MFVRYGSFDFHPWEAALEVSAEYARSSRGFKTFQFLTFRIYGEIVESGQYAVDTRLQQIMTAFSQDGQSCGLIHDDGSKTWHWMPSTAENSANLTDVQVISQKLPVTKNGEFVSGRVFEIVVSAMFLDATSGLLDYRDSLTRHGNAGPEWKWKREPLLGMWLPEMELPNTLQHITHSGSAIGSVTWPIPPAPFYPQPFENGTARIITHHSPKRFPQGHAGFRVDWLYRYTLPTFDDITAPTRG